MNHTLKILVPVGLGIVAAALNFMAGSASLKTEKFYRARNKIDQGTLLTLANRDEMFELVELPRDYSTKQRLSSIAVAEGEFGRVDGRRLKDDLVAAGLLFDQLVESPSPADDLRAGEELWQVPVESRLITREMFKIGNHVKFRFNCKQLPDAVAKLLGASAVSATWVGPFRLMTVGEKFYEDRQWEVDAGNLNSLGVAVTPDSEQGKILDALLAAMKDDEESVTLIRVVPVRGPASE